MMESKWTEKQLDLDLDLEETSYYGNAELLDQVWVNVLDNAVKFSPQKASVHMGLRDFEDRIVLTVQDNGSGMDENTKMHMFDKFFQGDFSHAIPPRPIETSNRIWVTG
jgi:signal transduction histidine kinase